MYTHINATMYPVGSNYVTHSLPAHRPKTSPLVGSNLTNSHSWNMGCSSILCTHSN